MASKSQPATEPQAPTELLAERRAGWNAFTCATVLACAATAAVLLFLLVLFKVIL